MKAFLLAAGVGSRLRPITDSIPKCLVPVNGKPLLYYWLKLFEKNGITEVLINVHHLPDAVISFLEQNRFNLTIHTVREATLLGSAGTVRSNFDFVSQEDAFLICYADNLTTIELRRMIGFHFSHQPIMTLGLFHTDNPQDCGVAVIDDDDTVVGFEEKPSQPVSNLASAGIYVCNPEISRYLPGKIPSDIGYDVLPLLIGNMKGYFIKEYFIDIGTKKNYERAQREFMTAY